MYHVLITSTYKSKRASEALQGLAIVQPAGTAAMSTAEASHEGRCIARACAGIAAPHRGAPVLLPLK